MAAANRFLESVLLLVLLLVLLPYARGLPLSLVASKLHDRRIKQKFSQLSTTLDELQVGFLVSSGLNLFFLPLKCIAFIPISIDMPVCPLAGRSSSLLKYGGKSPF